MVKSMRGQFVDMARLAAENAEKIALGNAAMNARGDRIERDGRVIKSQEEIAKDYHSSNPKAVKQIALRDINREVFVSPEEAVAKAEQKPKSKRKIVD